MSKAISFIVGVATTYTLKTLNTKNT